jgi:hypothetical protein
MGSGGVSSCDDDGGGEDEEGDEGDDDSSHANLFPILMTLAMGNEGDQEAMNMLLLLKHFLLREQFYLQQQLQETAMERNVDVASRDRATAGDHSDDESSDVDDHDRHDRHEASTGHRSSSAVRSPAPSVARLLGLSTSKTAASLQASPVGRTKTNGKSPRGSGGGGGGGGSGRTSSAPSSPSKQQQQQQWKRLMQQRAQWELQSKKYLEILDRFVAVETDLQALHGKLTPLVREVARDHAEIVAFQQGVASLLTKLVSTTKYLGSPERKRSRRGKRLVDIDGGAIVGEAEDDDEGEEDEEERVSPTRTTPSKRAKLMSKASPKTAVPVASSSSSTMTKKKRRRTAKTAVNSRNSVVNEWLKETDGSDDYADLENFLV